MAYDCLPEGAVFTPPLNVTFTYDHSALPKDVDEKNLYVAWWDGLKWWQKTTTVVNTETNTISFQLNHFSQYAVIGKLPVNTSVPSTTSTATVRPTSVPASTQAATNPITPNAVTPVTTPTDTTEPKPSPEPGMSPVIIIVAIFVVVPIVTTLIVLRWRHFKE